MSVVAKIPCPEQYILTYLVRVIYKIDRIFENFTSALYIFEVRRVRLGEIRVESRLPALILVTKLRCPRRVPGQ
jgi:hypothetical protein